MNVNENIPFLSQIIKIKQQNNRLLKRNVHNIKDKIDKYVCTTCHSIAPGL